MLRIVIVSIIGSIMLALAVMIGYELTKEVPVASVESTHVMGLMKNQSVLATTVQKDDKQLAETLVEAPAKSPKDITPESVVPSPPLKAAIAEGVIVPLDNGTVRADAKVKLRQLPSLPEDTSAQTDTSKAASLLKDTSKEVALPSSGTSVNTFPEKDTLSLTTSKHNIIPSVSLSAKPVIVPPKPTVAKRSEKVPVPTKASSTRLADELIVIVTNAPKKKTAHENVITRVRLEVGPMRVALRFIGASPLKAKYFALPDPERFVLDLQGDWALELPHIPKNTLLKGLRRGKQKGATRVVLDLYKKPKSIEVVQVNTKTVEVRLR